MARRPSVLGQRPDGVRPDEIVRSYLGETLRMIESSDVFEVLAHIDYPVRGEFSEVTIGHGAEHDSPRAPRSPAPAPRLKVPGF